MNEKAYKQLEWSLTALLNELKRGIGDDYRASDDNASLKEMGL